jgi:hypothetical protein
VWAAQDVASEVVTEGVHVQRRWPFRRQLVRRGHRVFILETLHGVLYPEVDNTTMLKKIKYYSSVTPLSLMPGVLQYE